MLESVVVGLEAAFAFWLNNHGGVILTADIAPIIKDWASAEVLNKIVVPFSKVMMAIQAKTATLADITCYWLYLARVLLEKLPKVAAAGGESSPWCFAAQKLPSSNMMSASPVVPYVQHLMRRV